MERKRFYSKSGSRMVDDLELRRREDTGEPYLKKVGEHSLYDEIQSWKNSVDLEMILKRFYNGDTQALMQVQGQYGDFTRAPRSMVEAYDMVGRAELAFEKLPVEVKQKFNNNAYGWLSQAGTDSWFDAMKIKQDVAHGADSGAVSAETQLSVDSVEVSK